MTETMKFLMKKTERIHKRTIGQGLKQKGRNRANIIVDRSLVL